MSSSGRRYGAMSTITVTALSRKAITDPALAQVVDEVAAVLKLEVARALATGHVPGAPVAPRARATVGQVALESWFVRLPAAKQRQVREGVIRTVQATPALARKARELGVNLASDRPVPEHVDLTARVGKLDLF